MSTEQLGQLVAKRAFDQRPALGALDQYHVPFDRLLSGSRLESKLLELALNSERIGLVGPSGAGKSSVAAFTFAPNVPGVAPITVQVRSEDPAVATEKKVFIIHLARMLGRTLRQAGNFSDEERRQFLAATASREVVGRGQRTKAVDIGAPKWLLTADVSATITPLVDQPLSVRSTAEIIEVMTEALGMLAEEGLVPVFVIDDSDSWFRSPTHQADNEAIERFFGETLLVVSELPCGLVACIHDQYLELNSYPRGTGAIDQMIRIPKLPDVDTLRALVVGRAQLCGVEESEGTFTNADDFDYLFDYYVGVGAGNIRRVMLLLHNALHHAHQGGADHISVADLEAALGEMP
jgi:hypothetical protein